ncbi:MAG: YggT family protein [Treponema sp.]|nr:YggT family protein [Treponema sp.]
MSILSGITSIYMLLIFIRMILTWFSGAYYGRAFEALRSITDPYLDWFRRFPLRLGLFDLSPLAALAVLSLVNNIFSLLARQGRISIGVILGMILSSFWSVASFILGFLIIVLALRLIAYLAGRNVYHSFWRIVDLIAQPVLYRINRIIFRSRLVHYLTGLITALAALLALWIIGGRLAALAGRLLSSLPF